jgi:hypothetical protein
MLGPFDLAMASHRNSCRNSSFDHITDRSRYLVDHAIPLQVQCASRGKHSLDSNLIFR